MKWGPIREDGAKSGWAIRGHFEESQSARIVAFSSQERGGRTRGHRAAPVITLTQMKWVRSFLKNWSVRHATFFKDVEKEALNLRPGWISKESEWQIRVWLTQSVGGGCCRFCALPMCFLRSPAGEQLYSHRSHSCFLPLQNWPRP